jgi:hypothetical protein
VERARQVEKAPKGWPAALLMFHLGMWRERMRTRLQDMAEGRTPSPPPANVDEVNDAEIANGIGTPLADASARSDHLLGEIIELYGKVGHRPLEWYRWKTTTEAVIGNSYLHPRSHLYEYLKENGETDLANRLFEDAVTDLADMKGVPMLHATVVYNLACARANQGRLDEALAAVQLAISLRPDIKGWAPTDEDLRPLWDDARFKRLVERSPGA